MTDNNRKFLNNLYPYFQMLDNINRYLNELININSETHIYDKEDYFYKITSEIKRLLPYEKDINNPEKLTLDETSGILLLKSKIPFLKQKYNKIIKSNSLQQVLKDISFIRNKYIHEPHNISFSYSVEGNNSCSMGLHYKNRLLSISTITLTPIVYYLNIVFNDVKKIAISIIELDEKFKEYPYYNIIMNYNFIFYNKKYNILPKYIIYDF